MDWPRVGTSRPGLTARVRNSAAATATITISSAWLVK